jgi:hypothetical protein
MKSNFAISSTAAAILIGAALTSGCAGFDGFWQDLRGTPVTYSTRSIPLEEMPAFPRYCLAGDSETPDQSQCLVDDAACYQLDTGNWCTGGRAAQCPRGSEPVGLEVDCPIEAQCWMYSTSLRCQSV